MCGDDRGNGFGRVRRHGEQNSSKEMVSGA